MRLGAHPTILRNIICCFATSLRWLLRHQHVDQHSEVSHIMLQADVGRRCDATQCRSFRSRSCRRTSSWAAAPPAEASPHPGRQFRQALESPSTRPLRLMCGICRTGLPRRTSASSSATCRRAPPLPVHQHTAQRIRTGAPPGEGGITYSAGRGQHQCFAK